jgi:hypothetical protein
MQATQNPTAHSKPALPNALCNCTLRKTGNALSNSHFVFDLVRYRSPVDLCSVFIPYKAEAKPGMIYAH